MNFQQFGSGTITQDLVAFNTTYVSTSVGNGGEGFQFYLNSGGTQINANLTNNTMIAADTGKCQSSETGCIMSYMIHGTGAYTPATAIVSGLNSDNFFDPSGAYGAYYPGSMGGWTSAGNRNMVTGAVITPP